MSLQWLNQCKCEGSNHNTVRGNCIARNIKGIYCDDCLQKCSGLTQRALDAASAAHAEADSSLDIIPASVAGSQPRQ